MRIHSFASSTLQGLGKTLIVLALITLQRQNIEKIFSRDETLYPLADVR
jgi:hypothetical protein